MAASLSWVGGDDPPPAALPFPRPRRLRLRLATRKKAL